MVLRVAIITFLSFLSAATIFDTNKKKIDKTLAKVWPEQSLSLEPQDPVEGLKGEYFKVYSADSLIAHLILDEAPSKVDNFSYMVVFKPDATIQNVTVLQYRENYGGEIASKRFLKQYIGKANGESMEYMNDIDGISGATISVRSLNKGLVQNSKDIYSIINTN